MIDNLWLGITTAFSLENLMYCFAGVIFGNLVGVLPGIGALAAISMLLPMTYSLDPTGGLMMLAGIFYGTSFGGATTSILLNLPGTESHAVVCVDGNPMARQGRAGSALFIAMLASFSGVCVGILLMLFFNPVLSKAALMFGPTAYFSLMMLGLLAASTLSAGSPLKGVASVFLGLILGVMGTDLNSGALRFTGGISELQDGLSLLALAMGLFGVADVFANAAVLGRGEFITKKVTGRSVRPEKGEIRQSMGAISRGALGGSFFGILPGTGGTIASFMSYALEKKLSRTPERFGHGAIEGVAGPEAANSSAAITAFIPTLTLGIPGSPVMALMLGALMIHNIQPGPMMITNHPALFWGLLVSFLIGNVLLLILNIPLIGIWVKLLSVPYRYIYPVVLLLICIGVYSLNNNLFDVVTVLAVGVLGYFLSALGFAPASVLLGFVLGPMVEENFRRALLVSRGNPMTFLEDPISAVSMAIVFVILILITYKRLWPKKKVVD